MRRPNDRQPGTFSSKPSPCSMPPMHRTRIRMEGQPKELLYAQRMTEMIGRFAPDASEVAQLAVRAQHIQRWTVPRSNYPLGKPGYFAWRTGLYRFHAETAGALMQQAGYDAAMIEQVKAAVGKQGIKDQSRYADAGRCHQPRFPRTLHARLCWPARRTTAKTSGSISSARLGKKCRARPKLSPPAAVSNYPSLCCR